MASRPKSPGTPPRRPAARGTTPKADVPATAERPTKPGAAAKSAPSRKAGPGPTGGKTAKAGAKVRTVTRAAASEKTGTPEKTGERIAKVLARAGVASRRDAERMIELGQVAVNGKVIDSPALNVGTADRITVDGKPLAPPEPARLWLYHKPPGLVTSARDEQGRPTVFDNLPPDLPRVMSVGRLDLGSEGLLLLTNDGALKRRLELPSTGWLRKYRVRVKGTPDDAMLTPLREGITLDGEAFQPMVVELDRQQGANAWLTVGIREGRNREIRRAMEAVGLTVNRLIRISYGPFRLGELEPGEVQEVRGRVLRDQLGAGFAEPPEEEPPRRGAPSARPRRDDAARAAAPAARKATRTATSPVAAKPASGKAAKAADTPARPGPAATATAKATSARGRTPEPAAADGKATARPRRAAAGKPAGAATGVKPRAASTNSGTTAATPGGRTARGPAGRGATGEHGREGRGGGTRGDKPSPSGRGGGRPPAKPRTR